MSYSCVTDLLAGINFTDINQLENYENLCSTAKILGFYFEAVLRRVLYVFIAMLILISIFGNIRANYKWIVLHYAVVNLIFNLMFEIAASTPPGTPYPPYMIIPYRYVNRMSIGSLLPLAINRFSRLYFSRSYEKLFGGLKILIFLFLYDVLLCLYAYLQKISNDSTSLEIVYNLTIMSLSIICSVLIFIKIRFMNKLARESTFENGVLKDLQRAALVCFIQGISFLIYFSEDTLVQLLYLKIYDKPIDEVPKIWIQIVLVGYQFFTVMYMFWMLLDACLLLFILKTYRMGFMHILKKTFPFIKENTSTVFIVVKSNIRT